MPQKRMVTERYWCPGPWPWEWADTCTRTVEKWCYAFSWVKGTSYGVFTAWEGCENNVLYSWSEPGPFGVFGSRTYANVEHCYDDQLTREGRCDGSNTGVISQPLSEQERHGTFAAIWVKGGGPPWGARHGLPAAEYQQAFDQLTAQGYRLVDVSGYAVNNQTWYAGIWEQRPGPAWQARHGLSGSDYQQTFNQLAQDGYRLVRVSGSTVQGTPRYAAIWEKNDGPLWVAFHGVEGFRYQQAFDELVAKGYRLIDVSGY
jgi:hypothetical protein